MRRWQLNLSLSIIAVLNSQYPSKSIARGLKGVEQSASAIHYKSQLQLYLHQEIPAFTTAFPSCFQDRKGQALWELMGMSCWSCCHSHSFLAIPIQAMYPFLAVYLHLGWICTEDIKQDQATGTAQMLSSQYAARDSTALQIKYIYSLFATGKENN